MSHEYSSYLRSKIHIVITSDVFIGILLAATLMLLINPYNLHNNLFDMDEIWNYQFARRILYGFVPYQDFAMLPIPLSAQLNGWILSITKDELVIMRWTACSVAAITSIIFFRILRIIGKSQLIAIVYSTMFVLLFLIYPKNNYNWFAVMFLSIALLLELVKTVNKHHSPSYELLIGTMLGLVTITKQNIGLAGLLASYIFLIYCSKNRVDLAKEAIFKFIGWVIIVGAELLYLSRDLGIINVLNHMYVNLVKFTGYASVSYRELFSQEIIWIFAALVPITILVSFICGVLNKNESQRKLIILVVLYSMANLAMVIPIADWLHLIFGMPISILTIAVIFPNQKREAQGQKKVALILLCLVFSFSILLQSNIREQIIDTQIYAHHYQNIDFPQEAQERIRDVNNLILDEEDRGQVVYFLNYQSALYLIPVDKFAYKYDDIIGRGSVGEKEMINKIATEKHITVIIRGIQSRKNWQETERIEEYVRNTMHYKQSIHGFDVYYTQ